MPKRGGWRPGAGNKLGHKWASTLAKEAMREQVRQFINEHVRDMLEAQVAQAKGLRYLVVRDPQGKFTRIPETIAPEAFDALMTTPDAVIEVWTKDPSTQAFTDLLNRAIDKPKEQVQEHLVANEEAVHAFLDRWKEEHRRQRALVAGEKKPDGDP